MSRSNVLPPLRDAAAALTVSGQPEAFFSVLRQAMAEAIGHRLFTIMHHDPVAGLNRRVYSSNTAAYPVSGFKPVNWKHPWAQRILVDGLPWIGRDGADIAWAYPDHEAIAGMGLASAMNLPVRWNGRTLGSVNLLHGAGHYTEDDAEAGSVFAALAVPALLSAD